MRCYHLGAKAPPLRLRLVLRGLSDAALITQLVLLSLLSLTTARSQGTLEATTEPDLPNTTYDPVEFPLNDGHVTTPKPQENPNTDGYISTEELRLLSSSSYRDKVQKVLDQVRSIPPTTHSACTNSNYLYDPAKKACGQPCTRAHCGEGMLLKPSSREGAGSCTCGEYCSTQCWARPSILVGEKCYKLATQGPCAEGEVIVPVNRYRTECRPDACLEGKPKNATNFSKWSQSKDKDGVNDEPFLFTYKDECYMTETEAFCGSGKIVRFLVPYKNPFCVPRDYDNCERTVADIPYVKISGQAESYSKASLLLSYISTQESEDGYISTEELESLSGFQVRQVIHIVLDQIPTIPPYRHPQCSRMNYLYDSDKQACGGQLCDKNMDFRESFTGGIGSCTCGHGFDIPPCWARPFILVGDTCYKVATQGPCAEGEVVVPVDRYSAKCGMDACLQGGPKNATNFSKWSQEKPSGTYNDEPFLFTYNDECYMTETEAFCGPGKVVRFLHPYKSPFCVPTDYNHRRCRQIQLFTSTVKLWCGLGFVEDESRNLCVKEVSLDFD